MSGSGVLLAPFNLCSVILAYVAAVVIDATGNYRLIWLFPAATGLAHATVNCWLKYPARQASSPDMVRRLWEWSVVQAESMAETGIVTGLLAAPLLGVVTKEDADSAVVIDMARNILGNPYESDPGRLRPPGLRRPPGTSRTRPVTGPRPTAAAGASPGSARSGAARLDGRAIGDQKLGRGTSSGSVDSEGDSIGGGSAGIPDAGMVRREQRRQQA